jgi:hypothetical protein
MRIVPTAVVGITADPVGAGRHRRSTCRVQATVPRPPSGDLVTVHVWMPVDDYDGVLSAAFRAAGPRRAPQILNGVVRDQAGTVTRTRPTCKYPEVAAFRGHDDPSAASSLTCRRPDRR